MITARSGPAARRVSELFVSHALSMIANRIIILSEELLGNDGQPEDESSRTRNAVEARSEETSGGAAARRACVRGKKVKLG